MTLDNSFSGRLIISQTMFQKELMTMHASVVGLGKCVKWAHRVVELLRCLAKGKRSPHLPESVANWARCHPSRLKPRGRNVSIFCIRAHVLADYDSIDE